MLSDNALTVLNARYLKRDRDGNICETPDEMFRRVANAVDMGEGYADDYYRMMSTLDFLPNSPTLMNAGTGQGTLSACFVLPIEDTMEGIMDAAKDQALVQKFGGGTGFAGSTIRPKGDSIATTHGVACGPVAVLRHLSSVSKLVTQGGKRDGANMFVLDVSHPDIEEFIECKSREGDIHNFNISVGVSDRFMHSVVNDADWDLVNPRDGSVVRSISAAALWRRIVEGAWRNGEPGVIFFDEVNREHVHMGLPLMNATNPCGEQPLLPNESCNLGSINVAKFVVPDTQYFNFYRLERTIRRAVRFLDNVIDVNVYATRGVEQGTKWTRKIGLGVMGWADALYAMGIPYDSQQARSLADELFSIIRSTADNESYRLGSEKGVAPAISTDFGFRNACRLTVAPTGTISMIADCSSGIEPVFALGYVKKNILATRGDGPRELHYVNAEFERVARERGFWSDELKYDLAAGKSIQRMGIVPDDVKRVFVTASDVSPRDHVLMQAAFQRHCDSGISKTINLPHSATVADVADAYMLAWTNRCKGITVYRNGSRDKEVLAVSSAEVKSPTFVSGPEQHAMPVAGGSGDFDLDEYVNALVDGVIDTLEVLPVGDNLTHAEGCDGPVVREEGCTKCLGCGTSAC